MENGQRKHKEKIRSLEVALRQIIQDKNNEIESMKKAFFDANDRLKSSANSNHDEALLQIISEKNYEISKLRKEITEVFQKYNSKILQEDANKQAIDGLLSKYSLEAQRESEKYLNEIKNLNNVIDEFQKENLELKQKMNSLIASQQKHHEELNAFSLLNQQNLKKNSSLLQEINEKDSSNRRVFEAYEQNIQETQLKNQELIGKLNECERMFSEFQLKISSYEEKLSEKQEEIAFLQQEKQKTLEDSKINKETYDQMIRTLSETVTTQCDDIYNLMQINEKYEQIIKEKDAENREIRQEFETKALEIQEEYEILHRKAIFDPKDLEIKFQAERTSYSTEITQLKRRLIDYEGRIESLTQENERLSALSLERQREINQWKLKNSSVFQKDEDQLKISCENFKKEIIELKEKILRNNAEKNELESKFLRTRKENEGLRKELDEAYEIIENIKENNQNNREILGLNQKIQALNQRNQRIEEELLIYKEKSEKIERINGSLNQEINILREKLTKKEEEYEKKTYEFNQNISELKQLQKKYNSAINTFESENRISVLKKSIIKNDV